MVIYYATIFNAKDVHSWSGLCFHIGQMLQEQGHDVVYLDDLKVPNALLHEAKRHFMQFVGKTYSPYFSIEVAKEYARQINKQVPKGAVIFSPNSILLYHLGSSYKKVLFTDSTFDGLLNFYPSFSNISNTYIEQAREIERKALHDADLLIYTSKWAADSAQKDYHVSPEKISIVPFGSNMDIAASETELDQIISGRIHDDAMQLLFIGVAWYRKGGDYAMEVLNRLHKMGVNAKLHIVGLRHLPSYVDRSHIVHHGFISKSGKDGHSYMASLFKQAHYLLLPSRADCTPVSISEANSFGLPCLVSDVGGNPDIVREDVNGNVFDFTNGPTLCTEYINYFNRYPAQFEQLCRSSFRCYTDELNWQSTGRRITQLLNSLSCKVYV